MWYVVRSAALGAVAATGGAAHAGSPEVDRAFRRAAWVCCRGLPLVLGALPTVAVRFRRAPAKSRNAS